MQNFTPAPPQDAAVQEAVLPLDGELQGSHVQAHPKYGKQFKTWLFCGCFWRSVRPAPAAALVGWHMPAGWADQPSHRPGRSPADRALTGPEDKVSPGSV